MNTDSFHVVIPGKATDSHERIRQFRFELAILQAIGPETEERLKAELGYYPPSISLDVMTLKNLIAPFEVRLAGRGARTERVFGATR